MSETSLSAITLRAPASTRMPAPSHPPVTLLPAIRPSEPLSSMPRRRFGVPATARLRTIRARSPSTWIPAPNVAVTSLLATTRPSESIALTAVPRAVARLALTSFPSPPLMLIAVPVELTWTLRIRLRPAPPRSIVPSTVPLRIVTSEWPSLWIASWPPPEDTCTPRRWPSRSMSMPSAPTMRAGPSSKLQRTSPVRRTEAATVAPHSSLSVTRVRSAPQPGLPASCWESRAQSR